MVNNARKAVFDLLLEMEENEAYSNLLLNKYLKGSDLSIKDKNLVTAIFYGVLENKLSLDYTIQSFSNIKLSKIDKKVLIILRMSVYQILYMDRIPNRAVVNEGVNLTKLVKKRSASAFVNGVLRSLIRNKITAFSLPNKANKRYKEVKYSVDKNIIAMWEEYYGKETTDKVLNSLSNKAKLYIRVNTLKGDSSDLIDKFSENVLSVEEGLIDNSFSIGDIRNISDNPLYQDGRFHIQGLASQICCELLSAESGQTVIDVCSAPGGKSFTTAQIMNNRGKIFAFDIYKHRVELIKEGARRLSIDIIKAGQGDASSIDFGNYPKADRVLCDVPCSGLGEMKNKPEIRYKDISNLNELYATQYRILCNASNAVKKGGYLLYSTCTLNPNENNIIADRFLKEHSNFKAKKLIIPKAIKRYISEKENQLTLFPIGDFDEGFFIAMFERIN